MTAGARTRMVHRVQWSRDTATGTNAWNRKPIANWVSQTAIPCWTYIATRRSDSHAIDQDKDAIVEDIKIILPKDAAIVEADRVDAIEDRQGNVLRTGPMQVENLQYRHRFKEGTLKRVRGD